MSATEMERLAREVDANPYVVTDIQKAAGNAVVEHLRDNGYNVTTEDLRQLAEGSQKGEGGAIGQALGGVLGNLIEGLFSSLV
jgi:hypothetical protein